MESDSKKDPSLEEHFPFISYLIYELLPEGVGEEWIGDLDEIVYEKRREKKYSQIEIKIIYILEILPIIYSAVGYRVEKIWGIISWWIGGIVVVGLVFGLGIVGGFWLGVELLWGEGYEKMDRKSEVKKLREEVSKEVRKWREEVREEVMGDEYVEGRVWLEIFVWVLWVLAICLFGDSG